MAKEKATKPAAEAKAPKKEKAVKAPKEEKAKRPLSAFMNFSKATRQSIVDANPGIAFGDVGKQLGVKWGKLTDAEKAKFKSKE
jgi:hypothetical protein